MHLYKSILCQTFVAKLVPITVGMERFVGLNFCDFDSIEVFVYFRVALARDAYCLV